MLFLYINASISVEVREQKSTLEETAAVADVGTSPIIFPPSKNSIFPL